MYLVRYTLLVGPNQHYAPSATAAVRLAREIVATGGTVGSVTRTRDGQVLALDELQRLAEQEIGPTDERPNSLRQRLARLFRRPG